jgi:hypothetical protein
MENRERDRVSQRTTPTDAGELNRSVEEENGRRNHPGTTAEFGQNIGEAEFPNDEGGNVKNRNSNDMSNSNMDRERESTRRPSSESGYGSSSGRTSGSSSSNEIGSDRSSTPSKSNRRDSSEELGSTSRSEGRH